MRTASFKCSSCKLSQSSNSTLLKQKVRLLVEVGEETGEKLFSRFAAPVLCPSRAFVSQSCYEALYRPSLPTHSSRLLLHHRTVMLPTSIPILRNRMRCATGRGLRHSTRGFGTQTQHERDHAHLSEEIDVTPGRWSFKYCYKATKFTCIKAQQIQFW